MSFCYSNFTENVILLFQFKKMFQGVQRKYLNRPPEAVDIKRSREEDNLTTNYRALSRTLP